MLSLPTPSCSCCAPEDDDSEEEDDDSVVISMETKKTWGYPWEAQDGTELSLRQQERKAAFSLMVQSRSAKSVEARNSQFWGACRRWTNTLTEEEVCTRSSSPSLFCHCNTFSASLARLQLSAHVRTCISSDYSNLRTCILDINSISAIFCAEYELKRAERAGDFVGVQMMDRVSPAYLFQTAVVDGGKSLPLGVFTDKCVAALARAVALSDPHYRSTPTAALERIEEEVLREDEMEEFEMGRQLLRKKRFCGIPGATKMDESVEVSRCMQALVERIVHSSRVNAPPLPFDALWDSPS